MIYHTFIYGSRTAYKGIPRQGTWSKAFAFDYLAGATVYVTPELTATIPLGAEVHLFVGDALDNLEELELSGRQPISFEADATGTENLYALLLIKSWTSDPVIIAALNLDIDQESSLYTVAKNVLSDAELFVPITFSIDTWLRTISIPYMWFRPLSHREALRRIAEACGGVAFQARDGTICVQGAGYLARQGASSSETIGQNKILAISNPVNEVINVVRITTAPYTPNGEIVLWETSSSDKVNNGESKVIEFSITDVDACVDLGAVIASTPAGATITAEEYFAWGGRVTVLGSADNQIIGLTISGKPLIVESAKVVSAYNSASTQKNGTRELIIDDNNLIQSVTIAEELAEAMVAALAADRRDFEITWRGNPALELGDLVTLDGIGAYITEQDFNFNGYLKVTSKMRRA